MKCVCKVLIYYPPKNQHSTMIWRCCSRSWMVWGCASHEVKHKHSGISTKQDACLYWVVNKASCLRHRSCCPWSQISDSQNQPWVGAVGAKHQPLQCNSVLLPASVRAAGDFRWQLAEWNSEMYELSALLPAFRSARIQVFFAECWPLLCNPVPHPAFLQAAGGFC